MSQRETGRRRSSLAGMNAISSHTAQQQPPELPEDRDKAVKPQEPTAHAEAPQEPKQAAQAARKAPKKKKVSFYLAPEEEARAKAAWQFTMGFTEHLTWTSFFEESVRRYTRELEAKYNDSKPFGKSSE